MKYASTKRMTEQEIMERARKGAEGIAVDEGFEPTDRAQWVIAHALLGIAGYLSKIEYHLQRLVEHFEETMP